MRATSSISVMMWSMDWIADALDCSTVSAPAQDGLIYAPYVDRLMSHSCLPQSIRWVCHKFLPAIEQASCSEGKQSNALRR